MMNGVVVGFRHRCAILVQLWAVEARWITPNRITAALFLVAVLATVWILSVVTALFHLPLHS